MSMKTRTISLLAAALVIAAGTANTTSAAEMLAGIAPKGRLVLFSSANPEEVVVVHITGLQPGEELLGVDARPATGGLYGLGSSSRIYTIDPLTGQAMAVGSEPFTPALSGTHFGFDFNPTVDRIRIVSDSGQNLRAHPITGAVVATDGSLAYAEGDSGFGLAPAVCAAAYTNNDNDPATGTMLFDIDFERDALVLQSPPNAGGLITVGALGLDVTSIAGFDVAGSDGTAYASLVAIDQPGNSSRSGLYTIDLTTGAAAYVGLIGGPKPLSSLTALGSME